MNGIGEHIRFHGCACHECAIDEAMHYGRPISFVQSHDSYNLHRLPLYCIVCRQTLRNNEERLCQIRVSK